MAGDLRDLFLSSSSSKKKRKTRGDDIGFSNDDRFLAHNSTGLINNFDMGFFDNDLQTPPNESENGSNLFGFTKRKSRGGPNNSKKKMKIEEENEVVNIEYETIVPFPRKKNEDVIQEENPTRRTQTSSTPPLPQTPLPPLPPSPPSSSTSPFTSPFSSSPSSVTHSPTKNSNPPSPPPSNQQKKTPTQRIDLMNLFSNSTASDHESGDDENDLTQFIHSEQQDEYPCFFCFFYKYSNEINEGPLRVLLDYINQRSLQVKFDVLSKEVCKFYMENIYPEAIQYNDSIPKMTETSFLEHIHHDEKYRDPNINYLSGIDIFTRLRDEAANASVCYKTYKNGVKEKIINTKNIDEALKSQNMVIKLMNENPKTTQLGQKSPYVFSKMGVLNAGMRITKQYTEIWNRYEGT